ncbi:MAG: UDP-N-acetylmuramoyl-tripeptide--D-alanyl-D-alanine ligase [Desulfoplanes sp.]|nr:UDP-N-acetylmuramoyl-tripeptide--D-alanyl-D-alanine ligase [Desulfoplanes sp.]
MRLSLESIASAMGAIGDFETGTKQNVCGVQTDSRLVQPGDLFVCIAGRNMDGHLFAAEAAKKGACAVVAHTPLTDLVPDIPVLLVRNTLEALGQLAAYWRSKTRATVIGVTGSAGKTTVKEMLTSVLELVGETAKNYKNWNNQLGLPLSILQCSGKERFWVMEAGISRPGDMDDLGRVLRPEYVLINNIGPCHLDGFKDIAGVARAKASLVEYMQSGGMVIANGDYPLLVEEITSRTALVRFCSTRTPESPFFAQYTGADEQGYGLFTLVLDRESLHARLPLTGRDMAEDLIAVATLAYSLGIPAKTIIKGLGAYVPVGQRFCIQSRGEWTVIDDTYNANPLSMHGAILRAAALDVSKPLVLVLGEMKELGAYAAQAHHDLGTWVRESGSTTLFFVGEHDADVRKGLEGWQGFFIPLTSPAHFKKELSLLEGKGIMLFKGSRSCHMEEYLKVLSGSEA